VLTPRSHSRDTRLFRLYDATPAEVGSARRDVREFCQAAGVDGDLLFDLEIVVTEACTNSVRHAYVGVLEPGPIMVELECGEKSIALEVSDSGRGGADRAGSVSGQGLALLGQLGHAMSVGAGRDGTGTSVRVVFQRAGSGQLARAGLPQRDERR
jgi:anti-sigma regulatory factor (Ser/Thr protein kinase)